MNNESRDHTACNVTGILQRFRGGALTVSVLFSLLVATALASYGLQDVLQFAGLGDLATGATGPAIVVVAFVVSFAVIFGGLSLWYATRSGATAS